VNDSLSIDLKEKDTQAKEKRKPCADVGFMMGTLDDRQREKIREAPYSDS